MAISTESDTEPPIDCAARKQAAAALPAAFLLGVPQGGESLCRLLHARAKAAELAAMLAAPVGVGGVARPEPIARALVSVKDRLGSIGYRPCTPWHHLTPIGQDREPGLRPPGVPAVSSHSEEMALRSDPVRLSGSVRYLISSCHAQLPQSSVCWNSCTIQRLDDQSRLSSSASGLQAGTYAWLA